MSNGYNYNKNSDKYPKQYSCVNYMNYNNNNNNNVNKTNKPYAKRSHMLTTNGSYQYPNKPTITLKSLPKSILIKNKKIINNNYNINENNINNNNNININTKMNFNVVCGECKQRFPSVTAVEVHMKKLSTK